MTKKRFYVAESNLIDGYCIYDKEKKYSFNPQEKRENCLNECKVLNELNDENNFLKITNGEMEDYLGRMEEEILQFKKENEQLKQQNKGLRETIERQNDWEKKAITEIEQLKSEIEKLSYANEDLLSEKRNWQRMSDEYCKLSEGNEQLKTVNTHLKNELSWIRDYAYWKEKDAFNKLWGAYMETCEEYRILVKKNNQLKQENKKLEENLEIKQRRI